MYPQNALPDSFKTEKVAKNCAAWHRVGMDNSTREVILELFCYKNSWFVLVPSKGWHLFCKIDQGLPDLFSKVNMSARHLYAAYLDDE